jgi:lipid-A-disaccharide synthase
MGFYEPLMRLGELIRMRSGLIKHFMANKPDVFVGIDSPDFNLGLEIKLRKAGIPVIHYVSPSVWAWRQRRIHKIAKATDLVLTLFPFEVDFYEKHNVPARFVGHPLADLIPLDIDKRAARERLQLDPHVTYIALLPGSRRNELKNMGELFVAAAKKCLRENPSIRFMTSAVNATRDAEFKTLCEGLPMDFFVGRSHDVMAASDVVLVTSGTATLETMLFKRPMAIVYRIGNITFQIAKRLIKLPFIGLPNLLAKQSLVPEFIQDAATPDAIAHALLDFLDHPEKAQALEKTFLEIHKQLRCDANEQAANAVKSLLNPS